jgi:hypothetical protein
LTSLICFYKRKKNLGRKGLFVALTKESLLKGKASVQLTSFSNEFISPALTLQALITFYKISYPGEEVNSSEPFPSVCIPCLSKLSGLGHKHNRGAQKLTGEKLKVFNFKIDRFASKLLKCIANMQPLQEFLGFILLINVCP